MSDTDGKKPTHLDRFNARRSRADVERVGREANERDAEHQQARAELAQQVRAAEDQTRQYSLLVQSIKDKYDRLFMTEGSFLDVYVSVNANNSVALYQVDEDHRGQIEVGKFLVSIDLSAPFSEQWPQELDGLTQEEAFEMAPQGMFAKDSRFLAHLRQVTADRHEEVVKPTPGDHRGIALS